MTAHRLTKDDHADLHKAATLVNEVCDRHPMEMTGPILTHLSHLIREIGVIETLLDAAA
jgi:hypothetical protein